MSDTDSDDDDDCLSRLVSMNAFANKKKKKSRFKHKLNEEGRRRRKRNICRDALLDPDKSPWNKLFNSGDDPSLITVAGFDHRTFGEMLQIFEPYFERYTPWTGKMDGGSYKKVNAKKSKGRGRKRAVTAIACLGLVLAWFRFRGPEYMLQGWFGFTHAQTNVWSRFGGRMLLKALLNDAPDCLVQYPDDDKLREYQRVVENKHDALKDVYCVADGLKLNFQACDDLDEQSMYYNGWTHGHYITNLFVFGPDGKIIDGVINVPGSVHDSTLAIWGGVYDRLRAVHGRMGGVCCVDSAFASLHVPCLLKSAQDVNTAEDAYELNRMNQATSLRQAAEWGMRALQGSMPRLKDHMRYERNGERTHILKLVPLLYNLRTTRVGLNQIASTYIPNWTREAEFFINTESTNS